MNDLFIQTSLIAAFVAGVVALFAPCCITFLLPAYLGSVFKERQKVLLMTLIFASGILVTLLPAVLGVAFLSKLLFRYHDFIYILGGVVMLLVAAISFLGLKLPMPNFGRGSSGKTDVLSIFILGIFSGITSSCCAPVLIGILTLTFLSPSFFGALLVGVMYVAGMVAPLLLISLFFQDKASKLNFLRKRVFSVFLFGKEYVVIFSNLVAAIIFSMTGILTLYWTATGGLASSRMDNFTKIIQNAGAWANQNFGGNLLLNILFLVILFLFIYWLVKRVK